MGERASWAKEDDYKPRHFCTGGDEVLSALYRDTSRRFHDLMDAAMLVSGHKYGAVADAYPEKVHAVGLKAKEEASLEKRLRLYRETGNVEYLVDIANFAMIEFTHPRHPKAHYTPTDASGSPGRVGIAGQNQMNNKDLTTIANG